MEVILKGPGEGRRGRESHQSDYTSDAEIKGNMKILIIEVM